MVLSTCTTPLQSSFGDQRFSLQKALKCTLCCFHLVLHRQSGMGWVSMMARLGAMVAPMVLLLSDVFVWLPGLIYGGAPIFSGIFAYFLPETRNTPLPDTIQDAEER